MNGYIAWIAAAAEPPDQASDFLPPAKEPSTGSRDFGSLAGNINPASLPAHQFPSRANDRLEGAQESGEPPAPESAPAVHEAQDPLDRNPGLRAYRGRTVSLLRRYLRYSLETGRLPSLFGAEFFRTRITSHTVVTFEDRVILVHDMETCLNRLSEFSRQLIARYILQEHDLPATARLLHCNEKTIRRTIPAALDELSEILLEVGLLEGFPSAGEKSCQEGEMDKFLPSAWKDGENKF